MISSVPNIQTTVVKVPHHGSDTSSSEHFVQATRPMYAVYCVGADNTFGHPHPAVVERYEHQGVKTLRTDRDGAVVFHTDGEHLTVCTYADNNFLNK